VSAPVHAPPTGPSLRECLADGDVHLLDGAMGTLLYERGVFLNVCYDELSLSRPRLVEGIHREYVLAGARIVETNTFGANPVKLSSFGLEERTEEINREAVARARGGVLAAGVPEVLVLGSFGPLGIRIEPWGPTSEDEAEALFGRQVDGLLEGGVDGFLLETFQDLGELRQALRAVRSRSDLPVIGQVTIEEGGRTAYGTEVERVASTLEEWGVDAVGLNCSVGPAEMLEAVERMAAVTSLPLAAQPNAGLPRTVGDRTMYLASPEYMAGYARRMLEAGVRLVGGCCGTTPDHIRRMAETLQEYRAEHGIGAPPRGPAAAGTTAPPPERSTGLSTRPAAERPARPGAGTGAPPPPGPGTRSGPEPGTRSGPEPETRLGAEPETGFSPEPGDRSLPDPVPLADRSRLGRKLSEHAFVTCIELVPPRGWDTSALLQAARQARLAGVDVVSLPDAPRGYARMAALPAAELVRREIGLEVLPHYACRDRNMLGMISDLMGAAATGTRNLLVVSGDPLRTGPYPDQTAVFDIDSIGLTNVLNYLNRGRDPGGHPVEPPTEFVVGVALNQDATDLEREHRRFHWKVDAGAEFAVTQPVFDPAALETFLAAHADERIPVIAGLWPLDSLRSAEFLENEVPGVRVPVQVMERMREAEERGADAAREEGVRIAVEAAEAVLPIVQGVQVSSARGGVDLALEVIRKVGAAAAQGRIASAALPGGLPSAGHVEGGGSPRFEAGSSGRVEAGGSE
jgi:methionine synthase / methylenetetrahydrofolate reductase(NADPH)